MYLKRLEIHGFKSFASRTVFEFGPGVTVIVGPNGSGKSNVAEAVRWALGEQSPRLLRLRRLEDAIFSGSAQRPAMGMAEVAVTLDNSQGRLPLAAAEVVVGRRAYRSGEGEYLINGRRCRLRDVTELLQRGGLSQNGYAVISQGLVDAVLNLRPEERRLLIEEAANLQRFHGRLTEALARIVDAREHMVRLQLLVDELRPRVAHLESQASRAAEHARIAGELARVLDLWYGERQRATAQGLARARELCQERRAERDRAAATVAALEADLAATLQRTLQMRAFLDAQKEELSELRQTVRDLEGDLAVGRQRQELIANRQQELQRELADLDRERAQQWEQLQDAQAQLEGTAAELRACREALAAAEAQRAEWETRLKPLRAETTSASAAAAHSRRAVLDLEGRWRWCQERRESLQSEAAQLRQQRQALASRLLDLARRVRQRKEHQRNLRDRLAAALGQRQAQGSLPRPVQEVLEAARVGTLDGLLSTLSQVIQVPRGLERAIQAALTAYRHAIVAQRSQDALAAIDFLARRKAGRALFVPLEGLRPQPPVSPAQEPGVVGVAAHLVQCPDAYRALVDTLLGRTIVVADVATARRLTSQGTVSAVTAEGTLFLPWGSIAGGSDAAEAPLASRQQGEALLNQLTEPDGRLVPLDGDVVTPAAGGRENAQERQRLAAEIASLQRETDEGEKALLMQQREVAHLRGQVRGLLVQERQALDEERRLAAEMQELTQQRQRLTQAAEAAEAAAAGASAALARAEEQQRDLLTTIASHSARANSLELSHRALQQLQAARQRALARLDEQLARRRQQLQQLEGEAAAIRKAWQQQEAQLGQARERLQRRSSDGHLHQELEALTRRERRLQEQLLAARREEAEAERRLLQAEAQVQRQEDALAALRQSMEADGVPLQDDDEGASSPQADPALGSQDLTKLVERLRGRLQALGPINPHAEAEYRQIKERYDFLSSQLVDLQEGESSLRQAIAHLERYMDEQFQATFRRVDREFTRQFTALFGGGWARLTLERTNGGGTGVDILAQPPGKRHRSLALLSAGERALTAIALLLALLQVNPSPFCLLDEVDAALDEANVERFVEALGELRPRTQFIIITHSRRTIEAADAIYGVSMGQDGASRVLSLRLSDLPAGVCP